MECIELMIVVAIIGILAAIAIPAYKDYTIRSQVTEGLNLAGGLKSKINDFWADRGDWPADLAETMCGTGSVTTCEGDQPTDHQGNYVGEIDVLEGVINITYGNKANADALDTKVLSLRPATDTAGNVTWICGYADDNGLTVQGTDATDIENKYLPSSCK